MTRKIGNIVIIEEEPAGSCEVCGKIAELRPYGPGGRRVCFSGAMKNEEEATRQFLKVLGVETEK
jgi:hypothetical protein